MSSPLLPNKNIYRIKKSYGSFPKGVTVKLIQPLGSNEEFILKTCDLSSYDKDTKGVVREHLKQEYSKLKFPHETLFKSFGSFYDVQNKVFEYTMTSVKFSLKYYIEEFLDPKQGGLDFQKVMPICFDLLDAFDSIRRHGLHQAKDFSPANVFIDYRGHFILSRESSSDVLKEIFPTFYEDSTPLQLRRESSIDDIKELEGRFVRNIGVLLLYCLSPSSLKEKKLDNLKDISDEFLIDQLEKMKTSLPIEFFIVLRNMLYSKPEYRIKFEDIYIYFSKKKYEFPPSSLQISRPYKIHAFSAKSQNLVEKFEELSLRAQQNLRSLTLKLERAPYEKEVEIIRNLVERALFLYRLRLEFEGLQTEKETALGILKGIHHSGISDLVIDLGTVEVDYDIASELERVFRLQSHISKLTLSLKNSNLTDYDGKRIVDAFNGANHLETLKLELSNTAIGSDTAFSIQQVLKVCAQEENLNQLQLNLSNTKLKKQAIKAVICEIQTLTKKINLFEMSLGGLSLDKENMYFLFDIIVQMKLLKSLSLDLSNNGVDNNDISKSLLSRIIVLQELSALKINISGTQISGELAKPLIQAVQAFEKLNFLAVNIGVTKLERGPGMKHLLLNFSSFQKGLAEIQINYSFPTEKQEKKEMENLLETCRSMNKNEFLISNIEVKRENREFCLLARRREVPSK